MRSSGIGRGNGGGVLPVLVGILATVMVFETGRPVPATDSDSGRSYPISGDSS